MRSPLLPAFGLALALALGGCAVPPGSPALALATPGTRAALDVLAQRTPADMAATEKVIARTEPGKAGWVRLNSSKPFIVIRDTRDQGNLVHIWLTDSAGNLANIATVTEYRGGHIYLHNPTLTPWRSWEEVKAKDLYDRLAVKLAAEPSAVPAYGPWPPAGK